MVVPTALVIKSDLCGGLGQSLLSVDGGVVGGVVESRTSYQVVHGLSTVVWLFYLSPPNEWRSNRLHFPAKLFAMAETQ